MVSRNRLKKRDRKSLAYKNVHILERRNVDFKASDIRAALQKHVSASESLDYRLMQVLLPNCIGSFLFK